MSEERLERIEGLLAALAGTADATKADIAALRTEMATKTDIAVLRTELTTDIAALRNEMTTDIAALRAEMATKADIVALRTELTTDIAALHDEMTTDIAALRAEMATKADLAGVAKNVDITALGRQLARVSDDITALKDDLAVTTAMAQRIDHVTSRLIADMLTEIRAEHSRMDRLLNRVRRLEVDVVHPEGEG